MSNFYEIAENLPSKSPSSLHPGGKKDKLVDDLIQRAIGSAGRVKDNMVFKGTVLYAAMLDEDAFKEKYWPDIVNYVLANPKRAIDAGNVFTEMYVYIQEICGCLPRPDGKDAAAFYNTLAAISKGPGQDLQQLAADDLFGDIKNAKKYLAMVKRFPKVYSTHFQEHGEAIVSPGSTIITVKFPYKYDTSIGVQVSHNQK